MRMFLKNAAMPQPGMEPGPHRWQRCFLTLDNGCLCYSFASKSYLFRKLWGMPGVLPTLFVLCFASVGAPTWPKSRPSCIAEARDRNGGLRIFSLTLSQLSYRGMAYGMQSRITSACKKVELAAIVAFSKNAFGPFSNPRSTTTPGIQHVLSLHQRMREPLDDGVIFGPLQWRVRAPATVRGLCRHRHSHMAWICESMGHNRDPHTPILSMSLSSSSKRIL